MGLCLCSPRMPRPHPPFLVTVTLLAPRHLSCSKDPSGPEPHPGNTGCTAALDWLVYPRFLCRCPGVPGGFVRWGGQRGREGGALPGDKCPCRRRKRLRLRRCRPRPGCQGPEENRPDNLALGSFRCPSERQPETGRGGGMLRPGWDPQEALGEAAGRPRL